MAALAQAAGECHGVRLHAAREGLLDGLGRGSDQADPQFPGSGIGQRYPRRNRRVRNGGGYARRRQKVKALACHGTEDVHVEDRPRIRSLLGRRLVL